MSTGVSTRQAFRSCYLTQGLPTYSIITCLFKALRWMEAHKLRNTSHMFHIFHEPADIFAAPEIYSFPTYLCHGRA